MKVIRQSIFETNSSSTHSICIADKSSIIDTLPIGPDGICRIYPGEFGWEEEIYHDAITKASYCLTHLKNRGLSDSDRLHREQMLLDVIKNVTKAKRVEFMEYDDDYYKWGYIDHQSIENNGGAGEPVFSSRESLYNFIFNPKSILVTDNDNH